MKKQVKKQEQKDDIPRPKEDIRIEKENPKFNSVLLGIIKKKPEANNQKDESPK